MIIAENETKHVISLVVENKPGVLVRVGHVFARRGFNIDSLVVSQVASGWSRMTVVNSGDPKILKQILKNLNKLIDVISAYDHTHQQVVERLEGHHAPCQIIDTMPIPICHLQRRWRRKIFKIDPIFEFPQPTKGY